MRKQWVRFLLLFGMTAICAFAQVIPSSGNPVGDFFGKITLAIVGAVGDFCVLVLIKNLFDSHQRGAGIVVGILIALLNVYAIKHYQDIINWL